MIWLLCGAAFAAETLDQTALRLRKRLNTEFLRVGTEQGDSVPAGWRDETLGIMKWADATIALGWTTGALALEVHLAERGVEPWASLDRAALHQELHHALYALERLDRVAETAFPPPCDSFESLNGFFIRDDVPADYHEHFDGIDVVQSDFIDGPTLKEMSQDQVHHLNLGLLLTHQLVPADVVVEGQPLAAWAGELGARMLSFVAQDDWLIRNPACEDRLVARGGTASPAAPGFAAIAAAFTDGALVLPYNQEFDAIWQAQSDPTAFIFDNPDNLHMAMVTAALGDSWGEATFDHLVAGAEVHGWWAYPLIHHALHDDSEHEALSDVLSQARAHLEELGEGEPYTPAAGVRIEHGWTSWHRYIRPASRHYTGEGLTGTTRNFGGDWLLLHHLVQLAELPEPADPQEEPAEGCGCAQRGVSSVSGACLALGALLLGGSRRRSRRGA
jgi:hypothetical protein